MILKLLRNAVGSILVFISWLSQPKPTERSEAEQTKVQERLKGHSIYQLFSCPFCIKTRRALRRLNINIDIKDLNKNKGFRAELKEGGGKVQVPCLRIEEADNVRWLYESNDIINYLESRVSST